jgi:predicted hotdog family 3-hydroxylacyl-ACP dehydratase
MEEFTIEQLIPQRKPFVMIDHLKHCDMVVTETELEVRADNIFCSDGVLREPGVVENIAQTCAARLGYINLVNGAEVKIGVIGALRNLKIMALPAVGQHLLTRIEVLGEVLGMTLVAATVKSGNDLIAECEMKIAISDK